MVIGVEPAEVEVGLGRIPVGVRVGVLTGVPVDDEFVA
jgi:hypothetical protein